MLSTWFTGLDNDYYIESYFCEVQIFAKFVIASLFTKIFHCIYSKIFCVCGMTGLNTEMISTINRYSHVLIILVCALYDNQNESHYCGYW